MKLPGLTTGPLVCSDLQEQILNMSNWAQLGMVWPGCSPDDEKWEMRLNKTCPLLKYLISSQYFLITVSFAHAIKVVLTHTITWPWMQTSSLVKNLHQCTTQTYVTLHGNFVLTSITNELHQTFNRMSSHQPQGLSKTYTDININTLC